MRRPGTRPTTSDDGPHRRLVELGWAEPHPYADVGTEFMVYGPRDADEPAAVVGVIEESLAFARGH